jgi:hypothetical protein
MSCPITLSVAPARFRHVIQFSMARALQDVRVLVHAGRASEEVIVHPLQPVRCLRRSARLRQEDLGHVVCVVTLARFSASRASNRPRSSADSITTLPGFGLSLQ